MAVIKAILLGHRNPRKHLRTVTSTSSQGITRVKPDALFDDKQFMEKTALLSEIAKKLVQEQEQEHSNNAAVTR